MIRVLLLSLLSLVSCSRSSPSGTQVDFKRVKPPGTERGRAAARFGDDVITDTELQQRLLELNPVARARYQTADARAEYVEGLAQFELLAQEAVKRGLASDPFIIEATKRAMVEQLLKQELEQQRGALSEVQLRAYYDAHVGDYVKPAMTRLSHIFFSFEHEAKAKAALEQAKALEPLDLVAFGKLAKTQSEEESSKVVDGDLRYLSDDELEARYGADFLAAARALTKTGELAPELVRSSKGLHVLKIHARQVALNLSFENAKRSIEQTILNETKQDRLRVLIERLKAAANFRLDREVISSVELDPKAPTAPSSVPMPGFMAPLSPPSQTK